MPRVIEDDDLAVENQAFIRQRGHGARDFGERRRHIVTLAGDEHGLAVLARGAHAVAIQLQLEHPSRLRERILARLGEHQLRVGHAYDALRRAELRELFLKGRGAMLRLAQLLDGHPRENRLVGVRLLGIRVSVLLLDQEPFFDALLQFHERPLATQLIALQLEEQLAFLESLERILEWHPHATVPDDDFAGAVVPLGDDAFEVAVLHGVVFDVDGEALVGTGGGGALGNGPRPQHPFHFETQVPVQPGRGVHVDDEETPGLGSRRGWPSARLRRGVERTLGAIGA